MLSLISHFLNQDPVSYTHLDVYKRQGTAMEQHVAFYAVFDGHGGPKVARFCGERLVSILKSQDDFQKRLFEKALRETYFLVDKELLKNQNFNNDRSGATATSVLISQDKGFLICANAGDTRAVLSTDGTAKPLSCLLYTSRCV